MVPSLAGLPAESRTDSQKVPKINAGEVSVFRACAGIFSDFSTLTGRFMPKSTRSSDAILSH